MFDDRGLTESRIRRFVQDHLGRAAHYREHAPVTITAYRVPGEPIPPREAIEDHAGEYEPIEVGAPLGRAWSTLWLHVTGEVPAHWGEDETSAPELLVDLAFTDMPGFQAEALVLTPDAVPVKSINPFNAQLPVHPGEEIDLYLECAVNPTVPGDWTFAPTALGDPDTVPEEEIYTLAELRLGLRDVRIWELAEDVRALVGLMEALPETSARRHEILRALEAALDAADPDDLPGTADAARAALAPALARPAASSALTVLATGHAHIDSAWLWPVRETVRKVARTFASACHLIENDPDAVFSASSAQQYRWLQDRYPELFERIRGHVAEGRFVPVGGMWVESDTNMPGSEAMARQFVAGKRAFLGQFGVGTTETWLPDSFGYSAALPQIAALAGNTFFLTQKVSWNQVNTFPHHTFRWEGLDGSSVFTHFPPADTYNGMLSGAELAYFERNFKEKGRSSIGMDLFGWGDGGGGPTREMMAAGRRAADLEGSPKVEFGTPADFFTRAREEYPDAPVWNGELYLELHRGTYSAQLATKQGNRRSEHLLHEAEALAAQAALRTGAPYPHDELEALWEDALLSQFHDILPGSSIAWVHRDAERSHAAIAGRAEALIGSALTALAEDAGQDDADGGAVLVNTAPVGRRGVPAYAAAPAPVTGGAVRHRGTDAGTELENDHLRAVIDERGALVSLVDAATGREAVAPGDAAALLQLHRDTPNAWDAWDVDEFYRHVVRDLDAPTALEVTEEDGTVRIAATYTTSLPEGAETGGVTGAGSQIVKTFVLRPDAASLEIELDLDWKERKKALKLAFPLDLRAAHLRSEIQFGHVDRPVPVNTSWDMARFETCAHRWVHLAEGEHGVAIANDSTYGHDVLRSVRETDGGTTTTARLTVVRSPEFPDPSADHGRYTVRTAIRPGAGTREAIEEGYRLNLPERTLPAGTVLDAPVRLDGAPDVLVETVKLAEDRSGDLVLRLYEAEGSRAVARLRLDAALADTLDLAAAQVVDLLERPFAGEGAAHLARAEHGEDGTLSLAFRPFQIRTVRVPRKA